MKHRNFKSIVLTLLVILCVVLAGCGGKDSSFGPSSKERNEFISQIGGTSETFKGAVSETAYTSKEEAAEAYVIEEVVGENDAEIVKVNSKAVLDEAAVNKLAIPEAEKEGIVEVEEVEVEYAKVETYNYLAAAEEKTEKVTVYIIKYSTEWKYFVPAPVTGDTISRAYYDSVFNSEKFANSTYVYSMDYNIDMKVSGQGMEQKVKMVIKMEQTVKYADGKIYLEQYMLMDMSALGIDKEEETMKIYIEEVDGEIKCYMEENGSWQETYLGMIGFSDMEELLPFANDYLDYSYFTKTDYGFKLDQANAQHYIDQVFADQGINDMFGETGMNMKLYAEYYVSGGALSGLLMSADLKASLSESGMSMKMTGDIVAKATCTNYGTTTITRPF